jgi:hypothetical protein
MTYPPDAGDQLFGLLAPPSNRWNSDRDFDDGALYYSTEANPELGPRFLVAA